MHALTVLGLFAASALAQVPGEYTPEVHPELPSYYCSKRSGCKKQTTKVVLDANYRWMHNVGGYSPCVNGQTFDPAYCKNATECAKNCAIEGVNYASYGISTSGDALTLSLFTNNGASLASPRVYLLKDDDETYYKFRLLNKEFTYDVDMSKVPCGVNSALYFSEMSASGEKNSYNTAGAKYGTGYCDAQCPKQNFINGKANYNFTDGACCNEMDIWEANGRANAFTPHPCLGRGLIRCRGAECGSGSDRYNGVCDMDGCDINAYRNGNHEFYGPGGTVDTTKPFTVVTQFYTHDNTDRGDLVEIKRLYKQGGKVIETPGVNLNITGFGEEYNTITDDYCTAESKAFGSRPQYAARGGSKGMGEAFERGMVLALSIWWDAGGAMQWLDGTTGDVSQPGNLRGPCPASEGTTSYIQSHSPDAAVVFSNIRFGELDTTYL